MRMGEVCIEHGHNYFIDDKISSVTEDLCECPCHGLGNPRVQTAIKTMQRSRYANFPEVYMHIPVQYGNLSRRERRCYELGHIGDIRFQGEVWTYYRICDDQPAGGRFWMRHIMHWDSLIHTNYFYTSYANLPQHIKNIITGVEQTAIPPIEYNSKCTPNAAKARIAKDENFFKNPDYLLDYISSYELNYSCADRKVKGNIIDDIISNYSWECVDYDLTSEANLKAKSPHDMMVMLKDGRRIIYSYDRWGYP
jgi:hypothetical protein